MNTITLPELRFIAGAGDPADGTACVMSAAALKYHLTNGGQLSGYVATDRLDCACPVARRIAIRLNDGSWWDSDIERTNTLLPFVDRIIGSRADTGITLRRMFHVVDRAVRAWTPEFLDIQGRKDDAEKLRALSPVVDRESAIVARDTARWIADAADAAAYAATADAAAYAAYAATAATAADADTAATAADADTAADAAAAYAARAASLAARAAAAAAYTDRKSFRGKLTEVLSEVLSINTP